MKFYEFERTDEEGSVCVNLEKVNMVDKISERVCLLYLDSGELNVEIDFPYEDMLKLLNSGEFILPRTKIGLR